MNKIKFKGLPIKLLGVVDLENKQLNVKLIDKDDNLKQLFDFKNNLKVISTFPKLNTSVCDNQTKNIARLANKYKDVSFISITMDKPKTIAKWCLANNLNNVVILSDKKHQQFSKATNLLIPKLNMLARGLIIVDQNNKVLNSFYKEDISSEPMFDQLEITLEKLLAK